MTILILDRVGYIDEKGENASHQHFLFFEQCFQEASCSRLSKVGVVCEMVCFQVKANSV